VKLTLMNQALQENEENLTHFIFSLVHDLREPIIAEQRILEQLKSGAFGSLRPQQQPIIEELLSSNQFVQHITSNMMFAYKHRQNSLRLNPEETPLAQLIGALKLNMAIQSLLKEKTHQLVIKPMDNLMPSVLIDRHEIQRVFLNLIKNAIDYTPPSGQITLATECRGAHVRVCIHNNGPAISAEIEPYLFKPYATSAAQKARQMAGTGLGLYLSKQIIEAHGGKIGYERQDDGTLFYFDLPVASG
jgi:signal transduction histidine kinase